MVGPCETVVARVVELLVGVTAAASPDLELCTICVAAIRDVEALVAINLDGPASESPLLRRTTITVSKNDRSTVLVVGLKTLGRVCARLEKELALVRRDLGSSKASESDDKSELRHGK